MTEAQTVVIGSLKMWLLTRWNCIKDASSSGIVSVSKTPRKSDRLFIASTAKDAGGVPGMNGAVEVTPPRPDVDVTVFEFGSVTTSSDKVTLSGYCPVSDDLEPCRWEILPDSGADAPQFRLVF